MEGPHPSPPKPQCPSLLHHTRNKLLPTCRRLSCVGPKSPPWRAAAASISSPTRCSKRSEPKGQGWGRRGRGMKGGSDAAARHPQQRGAQKKETTGLLAHRRIAAVCVPPKPPNPPARRQGTLSLRRVLTKQGGEELCSISAGGGCSGGVPLRRQELSQWWDAAQETRGLSDVHSWPPASCQPA